MPRGPNAGGVSILPHGVKNIRAFLRERGYNVRQHGPMTKRLQNAWQHYRANAGGSATGFDRGGAETWNKRHPRLDGGTAAPATRRTGAPAGARGPVDSSGNPMRSGLDKAVAKAGKRTTTHQRAKTHSKNLGAGAGAGGTNFPGVPKPNIRGTNTGVLLPRGMASKLAGLQFDPQIHELLTQLAQGTRDTAQRQRDIGHWYDQVSGAERVAGARDTAASTRAKGDLQGSIEGILQSLGGSRGAGVVGAAGVNDEAALAEQGSSQDRYNADLAPLMRQEAAGAHSREQALASQTRAGQNENLVSLRGQRGQAQAQALMSIIQANNASRQQNFGNRLALQNAALAAASLGLDADKTQAMLQQYGLQAASQRSRNRAQQLANKAASGHPNWGMLNPVDRNTVIDTAVKRAVAGLPAGVAWSPETAGSIRNTALELIRGGGYGSARKLGYKGRIPNRTNQASILNLLNQAIMQAGQHYQPAQ